jgi:indolepyruvate ferredoxin oxidoreductase beta subunit
MRASVPVRAAETIGMAQRGGSVCSHLRLGDGAHSPLVPKGMADLIIAFEPGEAVRMLPYLREGGTVVCGTRPIMPVSASIGASRYDAREMLDYLASRVGRLELVDADRAAAELGTAKALNVVLLGAAARSGALGFGMDEIEAAVRERVPAKFLELNLRALAWR